MIIHSLDSMNLLSQIAVAEIRRMCSTMTFLIVPKTAQPSLNICTLSKTRREYLLSTGNRTSNGPGDIIIKETGLMLAVFIRG
ncbi:hypothetical protein PNOK_0102500 [Pyrrhoderma noxium]|uniref:Uncharacterized protein n=1 Tax=Pyrrhoderma noxium TaxID=2282107 RepID=A0A286UWI7_9AGAM|nr:hypothetical protein PNOK_0102500 [Pyrrhoderma noxium]